MGMYDHINVSIKCPYCGERIIDDFQSKDGPCILDLIDPTEVNYFYSGCPSCHQRIGFSRKSLSTQPREEPFTIDELSDLGFKLD